MPSSVGADHRERLVAAAPEQELEHRGGRELRRAAEAAEGRLEGARDPALGGTEHGARQGVGRRAQLRGVAHRLDELRGGAGDLAAPVAPGLGDRLEELPEARTAVARLGRIVGAAVERLPVRREEDGHRPAAVPRQRDDRVHVDGVEVGPLLAIHLDADEVLVHQRRRGGILERLVLHHVAPVARAVADREQDRLVLGARAGQGVLPPRVPVHRVVGVLEEIRARLAREPVHAGTVAAALEMIRRQACDAAAGGGGRSPR